MGKYRYGETLSETLALIRGMGREELLALIKGLDGTGELQRKFAWPRDEDIREEALRQCRKDFESKKNLGN